MLHADNISSLTIQLVDHYSTVAVLSSLWHVLVLLTHWRK